VGQRGATSHAIAVVRIRDAITPANLLRMGVAFRFAWQRLAHPIRAVIDVTTNVGNPGAGAGAVGAMDIEILAVLLGCAGIAESTSAGQGRGHAFRFGITGCRSRLRKHAYRTGGTRRCHHSAGGSAATLGSAYLLATDVLADANGVGVAVEATGVRAPCEVARIIGRAIARAGGAGRAAHTSHAAARPHHAPHGAARVDFPPRSDHTACADCAARVDFPPRSDHTACADCAAHTAGSTVSALPAVVGAQTSSTAAHHQHGKEGIPLRRPDGSHEYMGIMVSRARSSFSWNSPSPGISLSANCASMQLHRR
jgi:hypothetical protein